MFKSKICTFGALIIAIFCFAVPSFAAPAASYIYEGPNNFKVMAGSQEDIEKVLQAVVLLKSTSSGLLALSSLFSGYTGIQLETNEGVGRGRHGAFRGEENYVWVIASEDLSIKGLAHVILHELSHIDDIIAMKENFEANEKVNKYIAEMSNEDGSRRIKKNEHKLVGEFLFKHLFYTEVKAFLKNRKLHSEGISYNNFVLDDKDMLSAVKGLYLETIFIEIGLLSFGYDWDSLTSESEFNKIKNATNYEDYFGDLLKKINLQ